MTLKIDNQDDEMFAKLKYQKAIWRLMNKERDAKSNNGYHKILIWFLTIIPVGIPLCAIIGLMYGIKNKDTIFTKCSAVALFVGIACIVYTLLVIKST